MLLLIARVVVITFGVFLVGLAGVVFLRPRLAERFLELFASSATAHFIEQAVRIVVGTALLVHSPSMWGAGGFRLLGWLLVVTSAGLLLVPWRWHQRFASWAVPWAIQHQKFYGVAAFLLGCLTLFSVIQPTLP